MSGERTKQEALDRLCEILEIPQRLLRPGSTIPVAVFQAAASLAGINQQGSMPEIGEAVAARAGVAWDASCDSRDTPSGGGSTVTLEGMNRLIEALEILSGKQVLEGEGEPRDEGDARQRVIAAIVRRRGQHAFRQGLLAAYEGCCAITGCSSQQVLDAAHISPYRGDHTNTMDNGLLLRTDIHNLFDLGLLSIYPSTMQVWVSPLIDDPYYRSLDGRKVNDPAHPSLRPSDDALRNHFDSRNEDGK